MGQLILKNDIGNHAAWLFKDAYYSPDKRGFAYSWPNPGYPYQITMHEARVYGRTTSRAVEGILVDIREWIEDTLSESVLFDTVDRSYRITRKDAKEWDRYDRSWKIENGYLRFHFRKEESAVMFKLRFGDLICPIQDKSPFDDFDYNEYEFYRMENH